ncbi:MAG TPA: hypothetical protein VF785_20870, partial [Gemmatimonadaceae bacterium]
MPLLFYSVFGSSARWRCGVTAILVIAAEPRIVAAQGGQPSCDGRRITTIQIAPERPSFKGSSRQWQLFARAIGLHHATTRADVVGAYLLFKRGEICADARLAESERILRALPFLADARVTASPDSAGGVIVGVSTTDEIPVLVTGSLRHTVPAALSLGNENIGGLGLRVVAGGERGTVYRGAAHLEIADYALFGQPVSTNAHIERDFLGESGAIGVSQPFLSDFQRGAWQASYYGGHDFPIVLRPSGDNGAVELHQVRWSASGLLRTRFVNTAALWGPVVFGARVTPTSQMLLITNSGAVPMTDSLVAPRLLPVRAVWLGGLFAMRRVDYMTRFGLDALFAPQDVMAGWETGLVAAPGVGARHDMLLATSTRAGFAT